MTHGTRYLGQQRGGRRTVSGYREYVDTHVTPFIGTLELTKADA